MIVLAVLLSLVLFVPACLYFFHGGGNRRVWGLVSAGETVRGDGAYRQARVSLWRRGSAPLVVRGAALSSFFLGQMIVPGGLMALVGVVATLSTIADGRPSPMLIIIQLSAPTGLLVAGYLLAAGSAMLDRADNAVSLARRAAQWAIGHNVVLLFALGVVAAASSKEREIAALPALYACFSIGQALLLRRAASAIEGYTVRQNEHAAPTDPEIVRA